MTALQAQTVPVPMLDVDLEFLDIVTEWDTSTPFHQWRPGIVVPATFRPAALPRVIVVANQKGGVGKTITSLELALAWVARGRRVRLIDADPQKAGLTVWLKETCYPADGPRLTLRDVFYGKATLAEATYPTIYKGLYLVPSEPDLNDVENAPPTKVLSPESLLRDSLRADEGDWDITIIDSGPNLGKLTVAALVAAQDAIIAIQDGGLEVEGTGSVLETIRSVRKRLNPQLQVRAIIFTDFKKDKLCRKIGNAMFKAFPDALIVPARESTQAGWASLAKRPMRMCAPGEKPVLDYDRAADLLVAPEQKVG
ncbi:ParA family protein [Streptomyces sp. NPDC102437]|uniref:ParA family protein n=1 Tax=Streptomyces sp. NPDC102437 TaxID=3366175 RepID=UPI003829D061